MAWRAGLFRMSRYLAFSVGRPWKMMRSGLRSLNTSYEISGRTHAGIRVLETPGGVESLLVASMIV